eukprot:2933089-Rhodomonas_salina.1
MSGTDLAYAARHFPNRFRRRLQQRGTLFPYAMSCTDIACAVLPAMSVDPSITLRDVWYRHSVYQLPYAMSSTDKAHPTALCPCYALSGTELARMPLGVGVGDCAADR